MPKGPRGEKRPTDVIGGAVKVIKIATAKCQTTGRTHTLTPGRQLGKLDGAAAKAMTPERRVEIAKKAAAKRWSKS
jgi:hypothetical protein